MLRSITIFFIAIFLPLSLSYLINYKEGGFSFNIKIKIMKYNHKGKNIKDATGVNAEEVCMKAVDLLSEKGEVTSYFIERLENNFTKRELAVMSSMFIQDNAVERDASKEDVNVEFINIGKDDLPPEVKELIKTKLLKTLEFGFDPKCTCEHCTQLQKEGKRRENTNPHFGGEGGNC